MPDDITKQAVAALLSGEPQNRGHAYKILCEANMKLGRAQFCRAVKLFENKTGRSLGKTKKERHEENLALEHSARAMTSGEVLAHIRNINSADQLFWTCWRLFRNEDRWDGEIKAADFAVHFKKPSKTA